MRIDIVFISWLRPEITELAIRTIHRNTKRENYRLIVIDNGSSVEQQSMLNDLQNNGFIDELILLDVNIGLEPARNMGLDRVVSEYFICADNDCLPEPITRTDNQPAPLSVSTSLPWVDSDWIQKLADLMERYEGYGAISCRTQVMIGTGNIFEDDEGELTDFPHPGGSLRIMPTELVKGLGGWRDDMTGRGTEERYICNKLHEAGYKTAFATYITCLHLFGLKDSDRWGYDADWEPSQTGHSDISHPVLDNGDDLAEVQKYAGEELTRGYSHN